MLSLMPRHRRLGLKAKLTSERTATSRPLGEVGRVRPVALFEPEDALPHLGQTREDSGAGGAGADDQTVDSIARIAVFGLECFSKSVCRPAGR